MTKLMTIGYEGSVIADFIATLQIMQIELLVDIRDVPASRKKGFSKRALSEALTEAGISYIHLKALGDPKPGREAARAGDYDKFRKIYKSQLDTPEAEAALDKLKGLTAENLSCLLCFERHHEECHRSIVANTLAESGNLEVRHIGVRKGIASGTANEKTRLHAAIRES